MHKEDLRYLVFSCAKLPKMPAVNIAFTPRSYEARLPDPPRMYLPNTAINIVTMLVLVFQRLREVQHNSKHYLAHQEIKPTSRRQKRDTTSSKCTVGTCFTYPQ